MKQCILKEYRETSKRKHKESAFLERVAPTIEGVKPSEILMLGESEYQELYPKHFKGNRLIRMVTIKQYGEKRQVFVYNRECLCRILDQRCIQWFLSTLGYPQDATLERYIEHLARRLRRRSFPHEIGVFLGYPLKDVFGYMGLNSLPHTKTKGWRMYGDTSQSEKLYAKYRCARQRAGEKLCLVN